MFSCIFYFLVIKSSVGEQCLDSKGCTSGNCQNNFCAGIISFNLHILGILIIKNLGNNNKIIGFKFNQLILIEDLYIS